MIKLNWLNAKTHYKKARGSAQTVLTGAVVVATLMAAPIAIDLPMYFVYQNQLQNAVDAAALAGASAFPDGIDAAEAAANDFAGKNLVAGQPVQASDLSITYDENTQTYQVDGQVQAPSLTSKLLCSLTLNLNDDEEEEEGEEGASSVDDCDHMTVSASAKAEPAARDVVLVIDNSTSMDDMGGGRPMIDVKEAANIYIDYVAAFDNHNVDRIGLVTFNSDSTLRQSLTSQDDSEDYQVVKDSIDNLNLGCGQNWCTNYETGLETALDELEQNGREHANKVIIFLTDGNPNRPAPPDWNQYAPIQICRDVENSHIANTQWIREDICTRYWSRRRRRYVWSCPRVPDEDIHDEHISGEAYDCMVEYTDYMVNSINSQSDRAETLGITVHTIAIGDFDYESSSTWRTFRQLRKEADYDPAVLNYMASTTGGQEYASSGVDPEEINDIYTAIAKDVRVVLKP